MVGPKTLRDYASLLFHAQTIGDQDVLITGIQHDSRKVKENDLFICLKGYTVDGHNYASAAVKAGASALVVERALDLNVPQIIVKKSSYALALFSNYFFDYPSQKFSLIGVTGTNGKTTTTYLVEQILSDYGWEMGLIGTIRTKIKNRQIEMTRTTPESLELQGLLADMAEEKVDACVMEVSSHALHQGRVLGCHFRTGVFTNLTQDHLDYHHTMEEYQAAKGLLFSRLNMDSFAIFNQDDTASNFFQEITAAQCITYGIHSSADLMAKNIHITAQGTKFTLSSFLGEYEFTMKMVGYFNIYNALAAITVGLIEGVPMESIQKSLSQVTGVPGRMESVYEDQPYTVIVDYAHTPAGLENVLQSLCEFAEGRVICVFGCGGDRDRTKRSKMGGISAKYADYTIITSDNPRTEDPMSILQEIETGYLKNKISYQKYECIVDREKAIYRAMELAQPTDVVLIAGKGHETYQVIGQMNLPFDDREVAKKAIRSQQRD